MKSVKEIYESLIKPDETVLFQVKSRAILNLMLWEFDEKVDEWVYWDKYKKIPLKDIYLFVGKWRLGAVGIFPKYCKLNGEYCFDDYLIDWKSPPNIQWRQEDQVNKFIKIMDKYRTDIRVSRKKYEDVTD